MITSGVICRYADTGAEMISCRSRGSGASSRRTLQMHTNKIVIISRADDTRLYNRSITALRRLYAGKTPHFNIPQERRAPAE